MGFLKKIVKGVGKLAKFSSKVVKGVANGGILGGIAAGVTNLKGSSRTTTALKKTLTADNLYKNSLPAMQVNDTTTTTDQSKTTKMIAWIIGGIVAGWVLLKYVFKVKF